MSKAVLISIKPKWCELIASGKKTIEVRKNRPKLETPFKCYIYCTHGKQNDPHELLEIHAADGKICKANGKVIGEFVCREIECFTTDYRADKAQTERISQQSCVDMVSLAEYEYNAACLFGWHISDLVIYDKPLELCEFFKPCIKEAYPWCLDCVRGRTVAERRFYSHLRSVDVPCGGCLNRPPQSWCYAEEKD